MAANVIIDGDADRLHQAVGNLLANTARHCRAGDSVAVSLSRSGSWAVLAVADTGPGLTAADQQRVFERLWRGDADAGGAAGMGIGLAIVKEAAKKLDATLQLSRGLEGRGCQFLIAIPKKSSVQTRQAGH